MEIFINSSDFDFMCSEIGLATDIYFYISLCPIILQKINVLSLLTCIFR